MEGCTALSEPSNSLRPWIEVQVPKNSRFLQTDAGDLQACRGRSPTVPDAQIGIARTLPLRLSACIRASLQPDSKTARIRLAASSSSCPSARSGVGARIETWGEARRAETTHPVPGRRNGHTERMMSNALNASAGFSSTTAGGPPESDWLGRTTARSWGRCTSPEPRARSAQGSAQFRAHEPPQVPAKARLGGRRCFRSGRALPGRLGPRTGVAPSIACHGPGERRVHQRPLPNGAYGWTTNCRPSVRPTFSGGAKPGSRLQYCA